MAKDFDDKIKDKADDMKNESKEAWKDSKRGMRDAGKWTGRKIKKGADKIDNE